MKNQESSSNGLKSAFLQTHARMGICCQGSKIMLYSFVLLSSVLAITVRWIIAVLFAKIFEQISEKLTLGENLLDSGDPFWSIIFLREYSFEVVLVSMTLIILAKSIVAAYLRYRARLDAEANENKRRLQVLQAATDGIGKEGNLEGKASNQVFQYLKTVTELHHYETWILITRTEKLCIMIIIIILLFVLLPVLAAVSCSIMLANIIIHGKCAKYATRNLDSKIETIKLNTLLRSLDVSRCVDVVAVSNTAKTEQLEIQWLNIESYELQKIRVRYDVFFEFIGQAMMSFAGCVIFIITFYAGDSFDIEPVDLVLSLFIYFTLMDESHKQYIYVRETQERASNYSTSKNDLNRWLESRSIPSDASKIHDEQNQSYILDVINIPASSSGKFVDGQHTFADTLDWEKGDIVLNNILLQYHNGDSWINVLDSVNVLFKYQRNTALVGESGCGKSSMMSIISGLLLPSSGNVYFGSLELNSASRYKVRENMVVCSQNSMLFARTIRENILYGHSETDYQSTDEDILAILSKVGLDSWMARQPLGLNTVLSNGEDQVSGGQAQRLLLARLFCKNREYVMLDEACSALDAKNRKKILTEMVTYLKGRTTVWITHHEDVVSAMDDVVDLSRE